MLMVYGLLQGVLLYFRVNQLTLLAYSAKILFVDVSLVLYGFRKGKMSVTRGKDLSCSKLNFITFFRAFFYKSISTYIFRHTWMLISFAAARSFTSYSELPKMYSIFVEVNNLGCQINTLGRSVLLKEHSISEMSDSFDELRVFSPMKELGVRSKPTDKAKFVKQLNKVVFLVVKMYSLNKDSVKLA